MVLGPYHYTWFCMYEDGGTNLCKEARKGGKEEAMKRGKGRQERGKRKGKKDGKRKRNQEKLNRTERGKEQIGDGPAHCASPSGYQ